jgi:hypothetical protein
MDFFGFIVKVFVPYARMVVIFHSERKNDDMVASGSGSVSRKMGPVASQIGDTIRS